MKRIRFVTLMLICVPFLLAGTLVLYVSNPDDIIPKLLFAAPYWILGIWGIIGTVTSLINYYRNRSQQELYLSSAIKCHKLIVNNADKAYIYAQTIAISLLMIGSVIYVWCHVDAKLFAFLLLGLPVIIYVFMLPIHGTVDLINDITAHVHITDLGISVESMVVRRHPWVIRWEHLTSIDVLVSSQSPTGIDRVMIKGRIGERRIKTIVIPGNNPAINTILEEIREYAPNKFT